MDAFDQFTTTTIAFHSRQFKCFLDEWGIQLRLQCTLVPSGNDIAERCHKGLPSESNVQLWRLCTDIMQHQSTPANAIHSYRVWIKEIDGMCPLSRREMRSLYRIGDPVRVKPPISRCTFNFKMGQVTGVVSEQSISVNENLRHLKDLYPAFKTIPLASDSKQESSESELLIESTSWEINNLPEPPTSLKNFRKSPFREAPKTKTSSALLLVWLWDQEGEWQWTGIKPWKWKSISLQKESQTLSRVLSSDIRKNDLPQFNMSCM